MAKLGTFNSPAPFHPRLLPALSGLVPSVVVNFILQV